jgi:hypothetical protein
VLQALPHDNRSPSTLPLDLGAASGIRADRYMQSTFLGDTIMVRLRHACVTVTSLTLGAFALGALSTSVSGQVSTASARDAARRVRFTHDSVIEPEIGAPSLMAITPTEAPTGFANVTNGFDVQGSPFDTLNEDNVVALRSFNDNRFIFEEVEHDSDGLGPTYNAQSCRECHQNIVTGGASQVTVQRAGHLLGGQFFDSQGGSLIHSRGTYPEVIELVPGRDNIRAFRISPNTLGDGFVEAIANDTLTEIRTSQPAALRGTLVVVPVLEANGRARYGRFGWKAQHASLESFSADAYLNEMGITSPLLPAENTAGGRDVSAYDHVADPEDDGVDVKAFANFMRSTTAPPRATITAAAAAGEKVFTRIGCASCHVTSITTAPAGTVINGGAMVVPAALGSQIIHPYSDFLLHDVGTGDGIPVQPTPEYASTANQMKTPPLWGLRTRNRLMHDGESFTRVEAIQRHGGQAAAVRRQFQLLSASDRVALLAFLDTL